MSMWIAALKCARIAGCVARSASVPSTSAGQMKRIVRAGRGSRPFATSVESVRAISRIVAQPLALSLAPGRWWSKWQLKTISSALSAGSPPGSVAVTTVYIPAWRAARTVACSVTVSPPASRARSARACLERHHEGEGAARRERIEMPPPDEILVLLPPGGRLVGRVADHPRGAVLVHRERRRRPRRRADEHELARARPSRRSPRPTCPSPTSTSAAVTSPLSLSSASTIGSSSKLARRATGTVRAPSGAHLPELGELRVPRRARLLRAVHGVPIRRDLEQRARRSVRSAAARRRRTRRRRGTAASRGSGSGAR